jgi:ankyrin repeat protein
MNTSMLYSRGRHAFLSAALFAIALMTIALSTSCTSSRRGRRAFRAAILKNDIAMVKRTVTAQPQLVNMQLAFRPKRELWRVDQYPPLLLAAMSRDRDWSTEDAPAATIVAYLLEHGADPNCRSTTGWTPLSWASYQGHLDIVRTLVEHGAKVDPKAHFDKEILLFPSVTGDVELLRCLLNAGAEVNAVDDSALAKGQTALLVVHESTVPVLLEHGADPKATSRQGLTLMHRAATFEDAALIKRIISLCPERLNAKCENPQYDGTPLMVAVRGQNDIAIRAFLAAGADVMIWDKVFGFNLLHMACHWPVTSSRTFDTVGALVAAGVSATDRDHQGRTPLHWAVGRRHPDEVRALIAAAPSALEIRDSAGYRPSEVLDRYLDGTHRPHLSASHLEEIRVLLKDTPDK